MADAYKVYDHKGKSLTGRDAVDRETAERIYSAERERTRGRPGEKPTLVRVGQEKAGPGESD
jgi:hypothetical protein